MTFSIFLLTCKRYFRLMNKEKRDRQTDRQTEKENRGDRCFTWGELKITPGPRPSARMSAFKSELCDN